MVDIIILVYQFSGVLDLNLPWSITKLAWELTKPWLAYLTIVFLTTLYYKVYLTSNDKEWLRIVRLILIGFSVAIFCYATCGVIYTVFKLPAPFILTTSLIAIISIVFYTKKVGTTCTCETVEKHEISDVEYYVCYADTVNAWYNYKTKKIYISNKLRDKLTYDEIKAVVHHEEGHARNKLLNRLSALIFGLWVFTIAIIMFLLIILREASLTLSQTVVGISGMLAIAAIITLPAVTISWITEHESDRRALEMVGLKPIVNALVKVHIYGVLENTGFMEAIKSCQIKDAEDLMEKNEIIPFKHLFKILLWHSLNYPKWISEYIQKPVYYTHPPLQLRLLLLYYSNGKKELSNTDKNSGIGISDG